MMPQALCATSSTCQRHAHTQQLSRRVAPPSKPQAACPSAPVRSMHNRPLGMRCPPSACQALQTVNRRRTRRSAGRPPPIHRPPTADPHGDAARPRPLPPSENAADGLRATAERGGEQGQRKRNLFGGNPGTRCETELGERVPARRKCDRKRSQQAPGCTTDPGVSAVMTVCGWGFARCAVLCIASGCLACGTWHGLAWHVMCASGKWCVVYGVVFGVMCVVR